MPEPGPHFPAVHEQACGAHSAGGLGQATGARAWAKINSEKAADGELRAKGMASSASEPSSQQRARWSRRSPTSWLWYPLATLQGGQGRVGRAPFHGTAAGLFMRCSQPRAMSRTVHDACDQVGHS